MIADGDMPTLANRPEHSLIVLFKLVAVFGQMSNGKRDRVKDAFEQRLANVFFALHCA